ncbi:hypothetical protein CHGG_06385 [Chaetomium globosum CBS 148.51]|uniref:Uncharacterized protein n=1 Tax=Chaetomium globosum (strain ATCC 6205 / CBS 148.51 / DSM 1962 / NBRC 6347 / NRRL 1970) TaxID=306901 RepID=Q2H4N0_CHAGB|nr:uncharacterized protein CHGG_06385 [Chaetomium globosum CBS 148.51]EAQ89766.1 hypothetical protein CHGG_06385 [Chaetomium globosum CBS 148.51]
MAPATRLCLLPLRPITSAARGTARVAATTNVATRSIHTIPAQSAKVVPVYGTGPPPEPPQPSAEFAAEIVPVLTDGSLLPRPQAPGTREVVQGWILSLSAFELAALERATLAGKSLLAAARLVAEWSEEGAQAAVPVSVQGGEGGGRERFGVEEAARAVSLEVEWQTKKWGEVEDTHDVEKEDLRRQLGSAVLLVSGTGNGTGPKSD